MAARVRFRPTFSLMRSRKSKLLQPKGSRTPTELRTKVLLTVWTSSKAAIVWMKSTSIAQRRTTTSGETRLRPISETWPVEWVQVPKVIGEPRVRLESIEKLRPRPKISYRRSMRIKSCLLARLVPNLIRKRVLIRKIEVRCSHKSETKTRQARWLSSSPVELRVVPRYLTIPSKMTY